MNKLIIKTFTCEDFKNVNGFVIFDNNTKNGLVIDTAFGLVDEMIEFIESESIKINAVLITHTHFDHFVRVDEILEKYNVPLFVTLDDLPGFFDPVLNFSSFYNTKYANYRIKSPEQIKALIYDNVYDVNGLKFRVIREQGHTKGSVMLDFFEDKIIFSGEILQGDEVRKLISEASNSQNLVEANIKSIVIGLEPEYIIYPSHFAVGFKIKDIIDQNIYVRKLLGI